MKKNNEDDEVMAKRENENENDFSSDFRSPPGPSSSSPLTPPADPDDVVALPNQTRHEEHLINLDEVLQEALDEALRQAEHEADKNPVVSTHARDS